MNKFFSTALAFMAAGALVEARTAELYLNRGLVADEISIDARVFDNRGVMLLTPIVAPFDTQATEIYRNSGLILAEPGFRFGYIGADGTRRAAQSFSNAPNARIEAVDSLFSAQNAFNSILRNVPVGLLTPDELDSILSRVQNPYRNVPDSYMTIWADSIVNRGALFGSAGGEFTIIGKDVDLSRSIVGVNPPSDQDAPDIVDGGFEPIPGSTEVHWGYGDTTFSSINSIRFVPSIEQTDDGQLLDVTNATVNIRYRVGTPSRPMGVDNSTDAATAGIPYNLRLGFDEDLVVGRNLIPLIWNSATPDAASASLTNPSTNQVFTIVLVRRASTNLLVDAAMLPPGPGSQWSHPTVRLRLTGVATNNITGKNDAVSYIIDNTFGSDPFRFYLTNNLTGIGSHPTNLAVSRRTTRDVINPFSAVNSATPSAFSNSVVQLLNELRDKSDPFYDVFDFDGNPGESPNGNDLFRTDLLTTWIGPGATNLPFTNLVNTSTPYMAYRVEFGVVPGKLPVPLSVPNISPTNGIGRLHIQAENLNLELARIRGQGPVIIQSPNVLSTRNASIDAPFVQADLGSKNGTLNLNGVFQANVQRLSGAIQVFSATFTNLSEVTVPAPPPEDPEDEPGEDIILGLEAIIHVMIVDADMTTSFPTPFLDMSLTATNVNIADNLTVSRFAKLNTENLTVNGRLEILGDYGGDANTALDASVAPILRNLTNNGVVIISNSVALGTDRTTSLDSVVNNGILRAGTLGIRAKDIVFGPDAVVRADAGDMVLEAERLTIRSSGILDEVGIEVPTNPEAANVFFGGNVRAYSQLSATAEDIVLGGGTIVSAQTMDLSASRSLTVEKAGAGVVGAYRVAVTAPPAGLRTSDLILGVAGQTFQESEFIWSGEDFGPTAAGFGNQAIARLQLDAARFSLLTFRGANGKGALYVEELVVSTNLAVVVDGRLVLVDPTIFNVASDFTIYFRNLLDLPASEFEAATGGKFKFIGEGGGDADLVTTTINGRTATVPRSTRFSVTLDTDGDGIANAFDASPFEGVVQNPTVVQDSQHAFLVRWDGAPWGSYEVQYSDGLNGQWKTLQRLTNSQGTKRTLWVRDPIPEGDGSRSYRVLTK